MIQQSWPSLALAESYISSKLYRNCNIYQLFSTINFNSTWSNLNISVFTFWDILVWHRAIMGGRYVIIRTNFVNQFPFAHDTDNAESKLTQE